MRRGKKTWDLKKGKKLRKKAKEEEKGKSRKIEQKKGEGDKISLQIRVQGENLNLGIFYIPLLREAAKRVRDWPLIKNTFF